jgi:hypothetical protein
VAQVHATVSGHVQRQQNKSTRDNSHTSAQ